MSSFLRVLFLLLLSDQNNIKILSTLRHLTVAQALAQNCLVFWLMFLLPTQFECTCSIYNKLPTIIFSLALRVCVFAIETFICSYYVMLSLILYMCFSLTPPLLSFRIFLISNGKMLILNHLEWLAEKRIEYIDMHACSAKVN